MIWIQKEIMNYMRYVCQFKKFITFKIILIILVSCAGSKQAPRVFEEAKREWFKGRGMRSFTNGEFRDVAHLFFDFKPGVNVDERIVNFVPLSFRDSDFHYQLDLLSGRRLVTHKYCKEDDVWERLNGSITNPPFSYGFIPGLLNKRKKAQKVILFGDPKYLMNPDFPNADESYPVKVIGGVVEQFCDAYPCDLNDTWENTVILVAVIQQDPEYKDVNTLVRLKRVIDWRLIKAFLENGRGRIIVSRTSGYPAYRIYGGSLPTKSLKFAIENGHLFSYAEKRRLKRTCLALYDNIYEIKDRIAKGKSRFNKEFYHFYRDYWKSFNTCKKFVRPVDISQNHERHWFFEFLKAFSIAGEYGYVYNCDTKDWVENTSRLDGKAIYRQIDKLKNCSEKELNESFNKAINLLTGFSKSNRKHYKYIQYDQRPGAHNEKVYSWVEYSGKYQRCQSEPLHKEEIFPRDIIWKNIISPIPDEENLKKVEIKRK